MALRQTGLDVSLYTEHDTDAALHFLSNRIGHYPLPSIILLDWHLQKARGDRFLTRLRSDSRFASIPVVVFTTSDDSSDVAAGYGYGANGYVVKPSTFDELVHCTADLCCYWLRWNRSPLMVGSQC
jgi:DNA-binding response OmpR family regulator